MSYLKLQESFNSREAVKQNLIDNDQWHINIPEKEEFFQTKDNHLIIAPEEFHEFDSFFSYASPETIIDQSLIEKYLNTENKLEKLKILKEMPLKTAIFTLLYKNSNHRSQTYIYKRLNKQQLLLEKNIREIDKSDYYSEPEYRQSAIDAQIGYIKTGLLRDIFYAEMIGTPEMAIYKIAKKNHPEYHNRETTNFITLKGYNSRINYGTDCKHCYEHLNDLYELARKRVKKEMPGIQSEEPGFEHQAILLATRWLNKAFDYNPKNRTLDSPYVSDFDEAIAYARLCPHGQARLRGMHQKIPGINLNNIKRFIGKSADNHTKNPNRTSLLHQAIDLYFHFKVIRYFDDESGDAQCIGNKLGEIIDWINVVPFGTIKRAHRAWKRGIKDMTILKMVLAEEMNRQEGKIGITRADLDDKCFINKFLQHSPQNYEIIIAEFDRFTDLKTKDYLDITTKILEKNPHECSSIRYYLNTLPIDENLKELLDNDDFLISISYALKNGFTLDEISKYPFLCNSLIEKINQSK